MNQDPQPSFMTKTTDSVKTEYQGISHNQEKTCGKSEGDIITVSRSDTRTMKKEADLTANTNTTEQVTKCHQSVELRNFAENGNGNKPDSRGGKRTVLRRNAPRWSRKSPRQEEFPERRRSQRRAKDDDLAELSVWFGDGAESCGSEDGETVSPTRMKRRRKSIPAKEKKSQPVKMNPGQRGRKRRQTTCTIDIGSEVLEQWQRIGTERNLSTDADIAAFLVKHFTTTDIKPCPACHSPLQLLCPHCPPPPTPLPSTTTPSLASFPLPSSPKTSPPSSPLPSPQPDVEEEEDEEEKGVKEMVPPQPQEPVKKPGRRGRKRRTEQQSHVCSQCGATFLRAAALKVHMRMHTGEKPFSCSECSCSFSTSGQLVNHRRKHTGERPYVCNVCAATFPLASSLKQHSRIHTGDRPYACHVCEQRFCYRGDLTAHVRKHTGDRPFLCSDCGKSFAMSSHLSKHKRIHSSYRPFECNICHKTFPFLNRLTLHMRTHTGEKPFLCADCGSSFIRASTLTIHRRIHHTFEKPCVCPYCQHAFADSANLSKHKKNKHGVQKAAPKQPKVDSGKTQLAENQSSTGVSIGQGGSVTNQLPGDFVFNPQTVGQVEVEAPVTTVVERGENVYSEMFPQQLSAVVSSTEGPTVADSDAHRLQELKPVGVEGPWKTFPFPV